MNNTKNYTITYKNVFKEPYYYSKKSDQDTLRRHVNKESWTTDDKEQCIQIIRDFLDTPNGELTDDMIRTDFGQALSDQQLSKIRSYYNGRLGIFQKIAAEVEHLHAAPMQGSCHLKYDIPAEYNMMSMLEDDNVSQVEAFIEVEISTTQLETNI